MIYRLSRRLSSGLATNRHWRCRRRALGRTAGSVCLSCRHGQ